MSDHRSRSRRRPGRTRMRPASAAAVSCVLLLLSVGGELGMHEAKAPLSVRICVASVMAVLVLLCAVVTVRADKAASARASLDCAGREQAEERLRQIVATLQHGQQSLTETMEQAKQGHIPASATAAVEPPPRTGDPGVDARPLLEHVLVLAREAILHTAAR